MTDKERRDKRFRKLCKWMSEAGEIAEILREDCAAVKTCLTADDEDNTQGIRSALSMLEFLTVLADNPANYRGEAFPELELGMKFLGVAVGEMKLRNCWGDCCAHMPYDRWRAWLAEEADGADCSDRADGSKSKED